MKELFSPFLSFLLFTVFSYEWYCEPGNQAVIMAYMFTQQNTERWLSEK